MKFVSFCIAACAGLLLGGIGGPAKAFAAAPIAEEPLLHARQLPSSTPSPVFLFTTNYAGSAASTVVAVTTVTTSPPILTSSASSLAAALSSSSSKASASSSSASASSASSVSAAAAASTAASSSKAGAAQVAPAPMPTKQPVALLGLLVAGAWAVGVF